MSKARVVVRSITVDVTQDDIDSGLPDNEYACPIAKAIRRQYNVPKTYDVAVGWDYVTIMADLFSPFGQIHGNTTREMQKFMSRFDYHKPVKPRRFRFKFDASILEEWREINEEASA